MPANEDIRKWLIDIGLTRQQLGEKLLVKKRTVDGWLSDGKPIPSAKMEVIERLMTGDEEIIVPLPDDFEEYVQAQAKKLKTSIDQFVIDLLAKAAVKAKGKEQTTYQIPVMGTINAEPVYTIPIVGNIAAGSPMEGDSEPSTQTVPKKYPKNSYALRVTGSSMAPEIPNDSLVIVKPWKSTDLPKLGSIVVYDDERGVTLKRLMLRDGEYILESINRNFPDVTPMDGGRISAVYVDVIK